MIMGKLGISWKLSHELIVISPFACNWNYSGNVIILTVSTMVSSMVQTWACDGKTRSRLLQKSRHCARQELSTIYAALPKNSRGADSGELHRWFWWKLRARSWCQVFAAANVFSSACSNCSSNGWPKPMTDWNTVTLSNSSKTHGNPLTNPVTYWRKHGCIMYII